MGERPGEILRQEGGWEHGARKVKHEPRPPIARANGYITGPDASNYTIQADLKSISVRNRLGDMGLVNSRYTIVLVGARPIRCRTSAGPRPVVGRPPPDR